MIIESQSELAKITRVNINGFFIQKAFYVDTGIGIIKAYKTDKNGEIIIDKEKGCPEVVEYKGKITLNCTNENLLVYLTTNE